MNKNIDINVNGFSIRCRLYYNGNGRQADHVVIATYGFGGNKENSATEKFADKILSKYKDYAVLVFDWPCHGADARNKLILAECITYFQMAIDYAREELGANNVYSYGTSFGAFITLLYLTDHENPFKRIALRCPAIRLGDIMTARITPDEQAKLDKGREIIRGYQRKIKVSQEFFDDLKATDLINQEYFDIAEDTLIIAGGKDEFVPLAEVEEFCDNNVIECVAFEKADHPFSDPKLMDAAIAKIVEFFAP